MVRNQIQIVYFGFVDNIPTIYPLFLRDANGNKVADPIFGGYHLIMDLPAENWFLTNAIADQHTIHDQYKMK